MNSRYTLEFIENDEVWKYGYTYKKNLLLFYFYLIVYPAEEAFSFQS